MTQRDQHRSESEPNPHDLTEAAEIIARSFPEVPERLRALHVAGPDGRCLGCQWINQPQPRWPCGPRALADLAWTIQHRPGHPTRR